MNIVILDYTAPLELIDAALPDHVAWLDEHYAAGHFLASGRRDPRTGGVILAADSPRDELEAILDEDPLSAHGLATRTVVRFRPSRLGGALVGAERLLE